jgi:two-component system response regulator YesN
MPYKNNVAIPKVLTDVNLSPSYWAEIGKELIDKNYSRLHKVEDVCSILRISASHFRDVFHMAYGINPKLYLLRVKVEKAMELLRDGSVMVYEVAMKVGIPQRNVFEKTFKKFVGITPSQYRKISSSGEFNSRKRPAKWAHGD